MADKDQEISGPELAQAIRAGVREAIKRALHTITEVQKSEAEALNKSDVAKKHQDKIKKQDAKMPKAMRDVMSTHEEKSHMLFEKDPKVLHPSDKKSVKKSELQKVTPPDISEKTAHSIKREYPGDKSKAYATMWSIHNHMKKSTSFSKAEELEKTVRCPGCGHPVGVNKDGKINAHELPNSKGKAEDCMGSGKQGKIRLAKNEEMGYGGDMDMAEKKKLEKAWRAGGPQPKSGGMSPEPVSPPMKQRGSVIAAKQGAKPAPKGKSPAGIRGTPMHFTLPVARDPLAKAGPPPIPADAQKPVRPTPIKPLKLPGLTPRVGAEPKMKLQPVVNTTPRAPTMGHVKVPPAIKSEPKPQTQVDKTLVSGANAQMGNFKSIASNPTKMPGGKMTKAEMCKMCKKEQHTGACK